MRKMRGFWNTLYSSKFAVSNRLNCRFSFVKFLLVMQFPVLPAPRPRLPVNLSMLIRRERKSRRKQPGDRKREEQSNKRTRSGKRRY